jgi:hypothetical protein
MHVVLLLIISQLHWKFLVLGFDFCFDLINRPDNKTDEGRVVLNDPYPDKLPAATRK